MIQQIFRPDTPPLIKWLVKYSGGLIEDEKRALYVIWGFIILAVIISLYLIFGTNNKSQSLEGFTPPAEASPEEFKNNK